MTKIRTYDDLLRHKDEVDLLLQAQKELVITDFRLLQTELKATTSTLSFIGKLVTKNKKNFLVNLGVNKTLDFVLRKVVLARAGWLTRLAVTFFAKNFSSHFIDEHKEQFVDKIVNWVSHGQSNGQAAPTSP